MTMPVPPKPDALELRKWAERLPYSAIRPWLP